LLLCAGRGGNTSNFCSGAGFLLHLLSVTVFIVELAVSQCISDGMIPVIIAIVGYALIMLCETWEQPYAFRSASCVLLAILIWGLVSRDIFCASHVNIWLIFLAHVHGLCLMVETDYKWARDSLRDWVKSLQDVFQ
jgi:hypothetical protein